MYHEQEEQITAARSLAREVNAEIERVAARLEAVEGGFLCECGRADCTMRLPMTLDEYEAIRADSARFFVAEAHPVDDSARVVERRGGYVIAESLLGVPG